MKTHLYLRVILFWILAPGITAGQSSSISFEQWISLKQAGNPLISPDGSQVLYSVTSTDWKENAYDTEYWLAKKDRQPIQITRTNKGSSSGAEWNPESKWIGFMSDRGNKQQIYIISAEGGEALAITNDSDGINNFHWSPDGTKIVLSKTEPESKKDKDIKERFGGYGVEGQEYRQNHLWEMSFNLDSVEMTGLYPCYTDSLSKIKIPCYAVPKAARITQGNFNVAGYEWSPDGKYIAYNRLPDPLINSNMYSDIVLYDVELKTSKTILQNLSGDYVQGWSPDSKFILYSSAVNDTVTTYYKNNRIFIYELATSQSKEVAKTFDENKNFIHWTSQGIWFAASQKTVSNLFLLDPVKDSWSKSTLGYDVFNTASFSSNGRMMATSGRKNDGLSEIVLHTIDGSFAPITHFTDQIKDWNIPTNEVIQWKSKDGADIEGVLIKPKNYQSNKKYPLLCLIHGGPTGVDRPDPIASYVYPAMQWCEKGAIILRVNYRGSAGYGEKFRSLNVRNLGVGDMWDVMSGVAYLAKQGIIDTNRMGCMGWSQGGYISAFLTTNTNIFKAISVGAGISDWMTYYYNTDITPFTRQYLKATPWTDPKIYLLTSPINNINKASTPTLIQHGEFDKRVPIPNAYELYRGLQDRKIPSKLIVYKGFGHGITKPKERLAATWHNWQWFNKYIWNEEISLPFIE
ncbi:MAG: S9 family peptidase [Saprospiraceae bacterium]